MFSRQGINVAFIGMNLKAQVACTEYLKRTHHFKRMDLEDPLQRYLRTMYQYRKTLRIKPTQVRDAYDALYKLDNEMFIDFLKRRLENTEGDVVIPNIRYLNELTELQKLGFTIVRVTSSVTDKPRVSTYVRSAEKDTVFLSMLYDKKFANTYNVDYSVNFTYLSKRQEIMDPLLDRLGYKFDINP